MISHLSIGVRDLGRAIFFYDAVLKPLDLVRLWDDATGAGYGPCNGRDCFALKVRCDAPSLRVPGFHVAFEADNEAAVDAFHLAGLMAGGRNDGVPGLRLAYGADYYAALLIDPDCHRMEAVHQTRLPRQLVAERRNGEGAFR